MKVRRPSGQRMLKGALRWTMVFLMIALSGCVFFTQVYRKEATIVFFLLMALSMLLEHRCFTKNALYTAGGLIFGLCLNFCLNGQRMTGANMLDYALLMIEILCVAGCVSLLSVDEFSSKYVRIMELVSVISLVCFGIQRTDLDRVYQIADTSLLNGYAISWYHTWGWTYIFNRNAGPFWEPGAFQGYLFVAILFLMKRNDFEEHYGELMLLAITVLTTMSTTGYILLGLAGGYFLCRYAKRAFSHGRVKRFALLKIAVLFAAVVLGVLYLLKSSTIADKFTYSNESFSIRMLHLTCSMSMVMERPIVGFGIMSRDLLNLWRIFGEATNSAGLFAILQYFGLVIGSVYILVSFAATVKVFHPLNGCFICVFFVILHMTESLLTFPVYICFIFLSTSAREGKAGHTWTLRGRR